MLLHFPIILITIKNFSFLFLLPSSSSSSRPNFQRSTNRPPLMTTHSDMDEFVTDWNKCKGISNCEKRRERERRHPDGRAFDRTSGKLERLATGSAVKNGRPHPVSRIESHLLPVIGQPLIEYSSAENSSFSNFYYSTLVLNYRDVEKFTPSFFFFFFILSIRKWWKFLIILIQITYRQFRLFRGETCAE